MTSFLRPAAWLLIAAAIVAPIAMGMNTYYLHVLNLAWIFAIAALGLSVATGVAGQIVLGQAALVGIGAYATALLMMRLSLPWWLALLLAMLLTGAVGAVLGMISTRIKGHYLAIVTLALNEIFRIVAVNEEALTGGPMGLRNIPTLSIPGFGETITQQLYLPLAGLTFASYGLMILFHRSALGRELRAVRDDEMAAEAMGVNSVRAKTIAFMICSVWAALSGGLYVLLVGFVAPNNFSIAESIKMMLMVVLGGLGSIPGTMLGAVVVTILPEALRDLQTYYMAAFGAAVVVIMLVWPKGLGVFADWLWGSFLTGRREPETPAPAGPLSLAAAAAAASSALATEPALPEPDGGPLMRVHKVSRSFGGVRALNDVSFDVMRGEILGLIGPNGSGKSTMINACSGVVQVDGSIELESHPLQNRPAWEAHALGVARIFQNVRLWESMTVLENVMVAWRRIPGQPGGETTIREASLAALEQMGVRHLAMRRAGDLSFGQSRLVEMARAIVGRPKVLLLDEPAAGLRGGLVLELSTILQRLRSQGMTILVVEHRIKLVTSMCDRVVVLNLGDLIADGTPAAVMESPAVIEAYLGERAGTASHETRARRIRRRSVDHAAAHG